MSDALESSLLNSLLSPLFLLGYVRYFIWQIHECKWLHHRRLYTVRHAFEENKLWIKKHNQDSAFINNLRFNQFYVKQSFKTFVFLLIREDKNLIRCLSRLTKSSEWMDFIFKKIVGNWWYKFALCNVISHNLPILQVLNKCWFIPDISFYKLMHSCTKFDGGTCFSLMGKGTAIQYNRYSCQKSAQKHLKLIIFSGWNNRWKSRKLLKI